MSISLSAACSRKRVVSSAAIIGSLVGFSLLAGCASRQVIPLPALAPTVVPQAANSASLVADRPADVSIRIVSPTSADELAAGPITVSVAYTGPDLIPAAQAKQLDQYHLHYLLDEDASKYLATRTPIPAGVPTVIHSAAKTVTFDNVALGLHALTVIMTGNNHISLSPPVTDSVSFVVR